MQENKLYKEKFYANRDDKTRYSAERILGLILHELPKIDSAVDIGCGVGTWLDVAKKKGASVIAGYDGPWVNKQYLQIPQQSFVENNLAEQLSLDRDCDLGISLEVFEHIPEEVATERLDNLLSKCRFLLFGAAIPMQGGTGHINEQPVSYWCNHICSRGFSAYDFVRPRIWNDQRIPYWYKQNTLLYVKNDAGIALTEALASTRVDDNTLLDIVHPELLLKHYRKANRDRFMGRLLKKLGIITSH